MKLLYYYCALSFFAWSSCKSENDYSCKRRNETTTTALYVSLYEACVKVIERFGEQENNWYFESCSGSSIECAEY